jgi:cell shape-determining protein MreC
MIRNSIPILLIAFALAGSAKSQSQAPVIVQPANAPVAARSTTSATSAAVAVDVQSTAAAIRLLEQLKSANDEVLAKQKAALEKLDQLKEESEQLQIFAKRG